MKFFQTVLAVIVGILIIAMISTVFFFVLLISASGKPPIVVKDNTILHLQLTGPIDEREIEDPFAKLLSGVDQQPTGLIELRRALQHAADDKNIKAIFLEAPYLQAGVSTAAEVRQMIRDFKSSGKPVIAYGEFFTEGGYYLSSVADEIYMAPDFSELEFNGMNAEHIYFKGALNKLGVKPVVFRAGKYKNAAESFVESEMSETERVQVSEYINSIYTYILTEISESRNIPIGDLRQIADEMKIRTEEDAVEYRLIDGLAYKDEVIAKIKEQIGVDTDKKIPFMSHSNYNGSFDTENSSDNTIAVVIAKGTIIPGKASRDYIASDDFIEELKKVRESDRVKAVVLRVNSPGGSALASDLIWHEIKLTAEKKPVIASMSDVAASGGYYLSMAADTIVAHPTTVTGSIGVIGTYFNFNELLENKLGITSDNYKTGKYSDLLNVTRPVSEEEVDILQTMVNKSYHSFVQKAADDRGFTYADMDSLAQGRVWIGEAAIQNKLIDVFGDLEYAIQLASEKAGIADDYKVKYYPREKTLIEQLLADLGMQTKLNLFENHSTELDTYLKLLKELDNRKGVQARLPYDLQISF